MSALELITLDPFRQRRWRPLPGYHHAGASQLVAVCLQEVAHAMHSLPLAFIESEGTPRLVAVLGISPQQNLFVTPDGRWLGSYIPALFRGAPFGLVRDDQDNYHLAIQTAATRCSTEDPDGEVFFDAEGKPTLRMAQTLEFLLKVESDLRQTDLTVACLQHHRLLKPAPLVIHGPEGETRLEGLLQIDEVALNALSGEALVELRGCGALFLAYSQLLSLQNFPRLGQLLSYAAKREGTSPGPATDTPDPDALLANLSQGGTLNLSGLG